MASKSRLGGVHVDRQRRKSPHSYLCPLSISNEQIPSSVGENTKCLIASVWYRNSHTPSKFGSIPRRPGMSLVASEKLRKMFRSLANRQVQTGVSCREWSLPYVHPSIGEISKLRPDFAPGLCFDSCMSTVLVRSANHEYTQSCTQSHPRTGWSQYVMAIDRSV